MVHQPTDEPRLLQELRANVSSHTHSETEKKWVSDHTLRRYLIARNWHVDKAAKMLIGTLEWRRSFGVDQLTAEGVKKSGLKGKLFTLGADKTGRPCFFMRPAQETTKDDHDNNLKHLVYQLERVVSYMDEDQGMGKMICVLDCDKYSSSNAPPFRTSQATLHILQDHYPERLGKFLVLSAPWYFLAFYKAISPFIDKNTKEKIEFVNAKTPEEMRRILSNHFDMTQFPEFLFGDLPADQAFNPETYYTKEGEQRGREMVQNLRAAAKH